MTDHIYVLYRHTSPSGKSYIGITKDYTERTKSHQRADGSAPKFHNAVRKYGWDAFTHEILLEGLTQEEAGEMEILCIAKYNTRVHGYNSHPGGICADGVAVSKALKGGIKTDDHIANIAVSCANREQSLETKIKAYMSRWKKTRDEAEEYYRSRQQSQSVYLAVKKHRHKKRAERMGMLLEPDSETPEPVMWEPQQ